MRTEAIAGVTTFFTMAYIIVVNPAILAADGTGMPFAGAMTATVLVCFLLTLAMGLYADLPFAVAPGMGLNAFFTYGLVLGKGIPWETALGIVFWSGLLGVVVSATPLRVVIARAIPLSLRTAAAVGIGLFLTFIGLKNAGLIVADPATLVKLGKLGPEAALCLGGGALTAWLMLRKSPLAFLSGILFVTLAAWAMGLVKTPATLFSAPDFSGTFLKLDIWGALEPALLPAMLSLLFTDLFDSLSTFMGVSQASKLVDSKGEPLRLKEGLIVDAFATMSSGLLGTSSSTTYIESAAGIEAGGRTGKTSVFTALCFLPCLFLAPLAGMVPAYATAPVLVLLGALMFRSVSELPLSKVEDSVPCFLTVALIPLTFSITQGILWGFITHAALYTLAGRRRELTFTMWALAAASVALLLLEHS
jgi:AGZA family xanthine/uracil permease-like MFS transporter